MSNYQVIARRYRPQFFRDALGQDAVVKTLQNALKSKSTAHAYLFSGPRGCGKTSLARIFAKALNCESLDNQEPCNQCASCLEISKGNSLDVLEIDGASNRGIDEVRKINETASYRPSKGSYKIIIIDEVHMLTHEAFNALLKTLEEPPAFAKFFFATTEAHKLPSTVSSRCQRFFLRRISEDLLCKKLEIIAQDLQKTRPLEYEMPALKRIAALSDGALRDAESLFEQVLSFSEGRISLNTVEEALSLSNEEQFFALDRAGKEKNLGLAFETAKELFDSGKDLHYFLESLSEHFRCILRAKILKKEARNEYLEAAQNYGQEQLLYILDLIESSKEKMLKSSKKIVLLEWCLVQILRSHQRVKISDLVQRLEDLEQKNHQNTAAPLLSNTGKTGFEDKIALVSEIETSVGEQNKALNIHQNTSNAGILPQNESRCLQKTNNASIQEKAPSRAAPPPPPPAPKAQAVKANTSQNSNAEKKSIRDLDKKEQIRIDNLLEFAAVELEGSIERN